MSKPTGILRAAGIFALLFLTSCMDYGAWEEEEFDFGGGGSGQEVSGDGVFVTCEGNFMYGTASLSYYIPSEKRVENYVFSRANGIPLGDVAQSMAIWNDRGYVVVNNSGIVFVIDLDTFKVTGTITGTTSPRYVHFVNEEKAYITDLYDPRITVFDPRTNTVTGRISTNGHYSTEQMVQYGRYVFTNCWSYDNKILVIDTTTDMLVDSIEVGVQPVSMDIDRNGKIWVLTDGGYEGTSYEWTIPALYRIDAETFAVEKEFPFAKTDWPHEVRMNGTRDTLYYINDGIWRMDVTDQRLPLRPFIEDHGTIYYGLDIHPLSSEIYVADAIDYQQPGVVYRYSPSGELIDYFHTGIIPGAFCFR